MSRFVASLAQFISKVMWTYCKNCSFLLQCGPVLAHQSLMTGSLMNCTTIWSSELLDPADGAGSSTSHAGPMGFMCVLNWTIYFLHLILLFCMLQSKNGWCIGQQYKTKQAPKSLYSLVLTALCHCDVLFHRCSFTCLSYNVSQFRSWLYYITQWKLGVHPLLRPAKYIFHKFSSSQCTLAHFWMAILGNIWDFNDVLDLLHYVKDIQIIVSMPF